MHERESEQPGYPSEDRYDETAGLFDSNSYGESSQETEDSFENPGYEEEYTEPEPREDYGGNRYSPDEIDAAVRASEADAPAPVKPLPDRDHSPASGTNLPLYFGLFFLCVALALAAVTKLGVMNAGASAQLAKLGLTPGLLFFSGIILTGLGLGLRSSTQRSFSDIIFHLQEEIGHLRRDVSLMTSQSAEASAAQLSHTVQEVEAMLSKQELMLSNLTKATRMFNKPLVDLVSTVNEVQRSQAEVKRNLLAIEKAQTEAMASSERKWEGMAERIHKETVEFEQRLAESGPLKALRDTLSRLAEQNEASFETQTKQINSFEEGFVDILSEHTNNLTDQLKLLREALKPTEGPDLSKIENALAKVMTSVDEICSRPAVPAPVAATTASSAPAATSTAAKPGAARSNIAAQREDLPQPISGTTKSAKTGKKVMSAIEKLKALRGG